MFSYQHNRLSGIVTSIYQFYTHYSLENSSNVMIKLVKMLSNQMLFNVKYLLTPLKL